MNVVKKEVKTFFEELICKCGGEMKSTNVALTSFPPKFPHKCVICGETTITLETYPKITYQTI